jgi:hypothetical protein
MPIVVTGLKEAQKAMRQLQPDLDKNLKKEIRTFLLPVVKKARGYAQSEISGLSNWHNGKGRFPKYDPGLVRRGIKSQIFPTRPNRSGFVSLVRIVNATAAGAIYETAGRKNPAGQPWDRKSASHKYSHSLNPDAGLHFINSLGIMVGKDKLRGRLIFRAWAEDQGKALGHILGALNKTSAQSKKYVDAAKAFRKAA